MTPPSNVLRFFSYAQERYRIYTRRMAGEHSPWTHDLILRQYRFCNVFREHDRTTEWIRSRITPEGYCEEYLGALIIARWFNRISTIRKLMLPPKMSVDPPYYFTTNLLYFWHSLLEEDHHLEEWKRQMRERLEGVKPIVTAAFIIKTPNGMNKLEGLLWCFERILPDTISLTRGITPETTLKSFHKKLQTYPYLGSFMAYEIVTDLRHTLLNKASDINTWAAPGPGAARGLSRILFNDPTSFKHTRKTDRDILQNGMRNLLSLSHQDNHWPKEWPKWEMREVEHTLCEFDKYERVRLKQGTPKQLYDDGSNTRT